MPRAKTNEESVSGYFRRLFEENLEWLDLGTNDEVVARWEKDHPNQTMTDNIKASMSNAKSIMRKKHGKVKRRKGGRRKGSVAQVATATEHRGVKTRSLRNVLERLEAMVDECLHLARQQENEELASVIHTLRLARNKVVWAMGEPMATH
jgi:hypothetical protein